MAYSLKELRDTVTRLTCESFSEDVRFPPKSSISDVEAERLIIDAITSYYGLYLIDELKAALINDQACMNNKRVNDMIHGLWTNRDKDMTYSALTKKIIITTWHKLHDMPSIGRNQALHALCDSLIECIN
jgi:hypothetical protein